MFLIKSFVNSSTVNIIKFTEKLQTMAVQYTGLLIQRETRGNDTALPKSDIYVFFIILTQFYINFSRHEHQIDVLYVSFNA